MQLDNVILRLRGLNEKVPKPGRLPTPSEVTSVEAELGVTFSPDYRRFLLEASDVVYGTTEPATITDPRSHTHLSAICRDAWSTGVPRSLLPICEDNGNYFCVDPSGRVVYWDHNGTTDESWPDLAAWIEEVWIGGK